MMKRLFVAIPLFALLLWGCASNKPEISQGNTAIATESTIQESSDSVMTLNSDLSIEVVGGDENTLRDFITQWFIPVYPDNSVHEIKVHIASTPKDIPYELPIPDNAHIIGTVTGNWADYLLIMDANLTPKSAHEFYEKSLIEKGWNEAPTNQGQGGFIYQSDLYSGYCYKDGEAFLSVETPQISDEKTSIRLSLDITPDTYMCNPDTTGYGYLHADLIPELHAPSGAILQGGSSGGSDRDAEVTASLKSKLSAAEVVEIYNKQLLEVGWTMESNDNGEGASWSNWTFKDKDGKDWIGTLIVIKASANNTLFALLRIEQSE